ncbi:MAG: hypothetical protein ETSY2_45610 [Candidatus Entotheonella gemina]|uniref:Uncharacterized protein n=1 Tax=Candidatus Entotheonella gemina TaxID=1429439 RepID=W4LG59_9BACT|nr:MAG: hypothetical protein ETSY2_45610 [Candidatus Entotheonella gemina]
MASIRQRAIGVILIMQDDEPRFLTIYAMITYGDIDGYSLYRAETD